MCCRALGEQFYVIRLSYVINCFDHAWDENNLMPTCHSPLVFFDVEVVELKQVFFSECSLLLIEKMNQNNARGSLEHCVFTNTIACLHLKLESKNTLKFVTRTYNMSGC